MQVFLQGLPCFNHLTWSSSCHTVPGKLTTERKIINCVLITQQSEFRVRMTGWKETGKNQWIFSSTKLVTCVPHRQIIRPILFNIFVNDLDDRKFTFCKPADDTKPVEWLIFWRACWEVLGILNRLENGMTGISWRLTRTSSKS